MQRSALGQDPRSAMPPPPAPPARRPWPRPPAPPHTAGRTDGDDLAPIPHTGSPRAGHPPTAPALNDMTARRPQRAPKPAPCGPVGVGGERLRINPAPIIIGEDVAALAHHNQAAVAERMPGPARQDREVRPGIGRLALRPQRGDQHIPGNQPPPLPEQNLHQLPRLPPAKRAAGDIPPGPAHPETAQQAELDDGPPWRLDARAPAASPGTTAPGRRSAAVPPAAIPPAFRPPGQRRPGAPEILRRQIQPVDSRPDHPDAHRSRRGLTRLQLPPNAGP